MLDACNPAARFGIFAFVIVTLQEVAPERYFLAGTLITVVACSAWFARFARKLWIETTRERARALTYQVELDDAGVRWRSITEQAQRWEDYLRCAEVPGALTIWHTNGAISFVPRTPETEAVIAFTTTKIRSDVAHPAGVEPAT